MVAILKSEEALRRDLRRYWLESIVAFAILFLLGYALLFGGYRFVNGLKYPSAICYLACFGLTLFLLNRQGAKFFDRLFLSILSMIAGIILFEIVYHYAFGLSPGQLQGELTYFGNSPSIQFPLIWYLLIFASLFIGRKYMAPNVPLVLMAFYGALVMFFWIGMGYPQTFTPPWTANYLPVYSIFNVNYTGPQMIVNYAIVFNWLSKGIAVIPALFFNKKVRSP